MEISGQTAIISGGGSGLGEATARRLASLGANVAILDFDVDRGAAVAADIGGYIHAVDVTDPDAVELAVNAANSHFGQAARIAVSCAGIGVAARVVGREGKTSIPLFQKVIGVNLLGSYYMMTFAARAMMEMEPTETGERGVIINTSSAAYQDGQVGQSAYAASKGAISAMNLPVAREFAKMGIRVNAVAPGLFNTPMMEALPAETTAEIVKNIPFPARLGHPEEYALMVSQIVENPYLNGETIRLDGATRLPPR